MHLPMCENKWKKLKRAALNFAFLSMGFHLYFVLVVVVVSLIRIVALNIPVNEV